MRTSNIEIPEFPRKTSVVNIHRVEKYDVYIGRGGSHFPKPTGWGNPKKLADYGQGSWARRLCLDDYKAWLFQPEQKHLILRLPELRGKILGCWCAPSLCHGDVLSWLADVTDPDTGLAYINSNGRIIWKDLTAMKV